MSDQSSARIAILVPCYSEALTTNIGADAYIMVDGDDVYGAAIAPQLLASAAHSAGFEIEPELTVHALELRRPVAGGARVYKARREGSFSKLNTYGDGGIIHDEVTKAGIEQKRFAYLAYPALGN